ncbi:MAG: SMP-30/gluconolactonase/LRE family protein [Devosia sp.]
MSEPLSRLSVLASGLDHPEGVCFAPDGNVYATGEAGQVYRVTLADGTHTQIGSSGGYGLGIAADAANNLYVCDMGAKAVVRVSQDGKATTYSAGAEEQPFTVPNFPVFDAKGNLFVSNSGGWGAMDGHIQRIDANGKAGVWSRTAKGFTNGLAISPDGRFLYVVESTPPLISRIAINPDGSAGTYEVFVELPASVPDGIAFDSVGTLYVACYAPDRIYRIAQGGKPEILFDDWARMSLNAPTNLAFAGASLDRLLISSLGGYSLTSVTLGVTGAKLHYPRIVA